MGRTDEIQNIPVDRKSFYYFGQDIVNEFTTDSQYSEIYSKYLDDIIYKIDSNLHITNRTNRERIIEYERYQKILRPFLPTMLMYSMLLNN